MLQSATRTMKSLLEMSAVPTMAIGVGREYQEGTPRSMGRALNDNELHALMIGGSIPSEPTDDLGGSLFFEVEIAGHRDRAWLHIFDNPWLPEFDDEGTLPVVEAIISPTRTVVGVVVSLSVALGVAIASAGRVVQDEIKVMSSDLDDFESFIAEYGLKGGGGNFVDRCEHFLRQFPQLNGWPLDVSMH
ncbi:hypothetical protein OUY22_23880 [Nonomuraea sp. MCN248]|uniref:Uncharacterized protein n=1 Tax=Nonomuraea corallina TaxID=2989783 RepID=A0ABT4SHH7_9ACTN|nr:hypothetical protein [Nonomuraea corallina]MDA0636468.1 hypothetical protein [Nonomuraea corallina]